MTKEIFSEVKEEIFRSYISKRPQSNKLHEAAKAYLPGGDTRTVTFFRPFPTFMQRGEGFNLYDVDGNIYTDFFNNATSLVHGHAHPAVVKAVTDQVRMGSIYAAPVESQTQLAQILCDRLPSINKVRFCNSGTEATMTAIRLARAFTEKYKILKMEGGYNGGYELVEISIKPDLEKAGPVTAPNSVPEDVSIPPNVVKDCLVAPFNEAQIARQIIEVHKDELAAVIVEPIQGAGGYIPAGRDFLETLREATLENNVLLIFDEVQTLRLAPGGCQQRYNVMPDITVLGKIIGGGYPVGAVAGDEKHLDLFSPLNAQFLTHSGTFNGSPVVMAAGIATLNALTASEIDRINTLGEMLRNKFANLLKEVGVIAQVTGVGSFAQIHFTDQQIGSWRQAATARKDIWALLHLLLMDKGIVLLPRGAFNISTPMTEKQIENAAAAVKSSLVQLKPYMQKSAPQLIAA